MSVFMDLAPGDTLLIGADTRIRMEHKSGKRARLAVTSDADVKRVPAGDPVPPQANKTVPAGLARLRIPDDKTTNTSTYLRRPFHHTTR